MPLVVKKDFAAVGPEKSDDVLEHHALAAAAGAEHDERLALFDRQIDLVQHDEVAEALEMLRSSMRGMEETVGGE